MPIDGQQQIYGAQHPPSIKLIKELKANPTSAISNNSINNTQSTSSSSSSSNQFKDFEKKTIDAWDIDEDECFSYTLNSLNDAFPISIVDSEEVAKKVIKSHKENQEKLLSPTTKTNQRQSVNTQVKTPSNGPGKALRQELSNDSNLNIVTNSLQSASISSNKQTSNAKVEESITPTGLQNSSSITSISSRSSSNNGNQASFNSSVTTNIEPKSDSNQTNYNFKYTSFLSNRDNDEDQSRCEKFKQILTNSPINLVDLEKISWKGIPKTYRPICWKLLSDYLPLKIDLQEKTIEQKRNSYWESVTECYSPTFLDLNHETLRQILNDIPRMNPLIPIFQNDVVQNIFQRVLYVWAVRHPGSGYVQGINDLLTPFFVVFLTEHIEINNYTEIQAKDIEKLSKDVLRNLEADCYWCMTKLLDRIQENYVFSQPGIQRKIIALEELMKRIDRTLYQHLKKNNIEFIQFAFRWMNNLLMREIPLSCTIRLWDTYHAEPFGFSDFHLYVCAAFLQRYSKNLIEEKDFQGLMLLLQSLPTRNFKANDITLLTAEAYKLQVMFANSPNHTATLHQ